MSSTVARRRSRTRQASAEQESAEALVHAAAQLPDGVRLDLPRHVVEPHLRLMLAGYGIGHRVRLIDGEGSLPTAPTLGQLVEQLWPANGEASATARADGVLQGHRVAVVTNLPAHYRLAIFAGMERRLQAVGAAFRVCFLGASDPKRTWFDVEEELSFGHTFVPSVSLPVRRVRPPRAPLRLTKALRAYRPTIVLTAGFGAAALITARHATRHGAAYGIWSGEIASRAVGLSHFRGLQRRALARRANFSVAYGSGSAAYLRTLAPDLPVVIGRNTSTGGAGRCAPGGGRLRLLMVGDLNSPNKGVDTIIEAFRLRPDLDCELEVIGGGRLLCELEHAAAPDERIRFSGARSPAQVRSACATSNGFLFPTRNDVFGLALVEAMGAGLAPIISAAPGALLDLAVPGGNCLVLEGNDPTAWATAIARLVEDPALLDRLGSAAQATISRRWTAAHAIEGMMAGLRVGALARREVRRC